MSTEAELGYQDAIRQVHRNLQRRLKSLHDQAKDASLEVIKETKIRMNEVEHLIQIVESLHR